MREHGTFACYKFGPEGGDHHNGCRCSDCRAANTAYYHQRKRRVEPAYVSANPAREHIAALADQGIGLKTLAAVSGVSHGGLTKIVYGVSAGPGRKAREPSKRVRPATLAAILAVTPSQGAGGSRVPAGPVWVDIATLLRRGWTKSKISEAIGQGGKALQIGSEVVTRRNAAAIHALLDEAVPSDVGRAWSAHHQAAATEPAAPSRDDILRDQARRAELTNRQRRARHGDDFEPVTYDDINLLLIEAAEMLEARIDQREWRARSACKAQPPWMFFPARGDSVTLKAAKAVCGTCPVSAECLAANLAQPDGVWGGTSGAERRALRQGAAA